MTDRHPTSGPIDLSGRVAIVTGGAAGIGRVVCMALAREGADVVALDLGSAEGTAEAVRALGRRARGERVDVTDPSWVTRLVDGVVAEFGRVDVLVNCAGVVERTALAAVRPEIWARTLDVNLRGTFNCIQAVYPHMQARGYGKIVNLASVAGKVGGPVARPSASRLEGGRSGPAYAASKGGVIALTKWIAKDGGCLGIWCNCVCPGPIRTDMTRGFDYAVEGLPIPRMGEPEDVAEAVIFLASNASNFITGAALNVDGGLVMD